MFATTQSPHVQASQEILTRYVRCILQEAGIDMNVLTLYSCKHASTSSVTRKQVLITTILYGMGWTGENAFPRFYNRPTVVINLIPTIWEQNSLLNM